MPAKLQLKLFLRNMVNILLCDTIAHIVSNCLQRVYSLNFKFVLFNLSVQGAS